MTVLLVGDDVGDAEAGGDNESTADLDVVQYQLDPEEAKEFQDFGPRINDEESWQLPPSMAKFLDKYFNTCLDDKEQQAILADFPKPQCDALQA